MDPPEWEAEPIADPCDEAAGAAETLLDAGLPLIVAVLALLCAPIAAADPLLEAPPAMAGAGGECGAIIARGAELSRATRSSDVAVDGLPTAAGAPEDRTKEELLATDGDCTDRFVVPVNAGAEAAAACSINPSRATGTLAPALMVPLSDCDARIAVVGIEANWIFEALVVIGGPLGIHAS
jgi:hypothetical protein